jgi:uncharacterized membrane protein YvlD (DUF360 family)
MRVRRLARLTVIVVVDALALLLLSELLDGFRLDGPVAALGLALALGLANAVLWPAILRVALPFTVVTLGLGALLLNGVVLVGIAGAFKAVHVADLGTAVVVILGMTLLTTAIAGVLALDSDELWYRHVVRRQLRRTKLAVNTEVPGLLLLEIDGLAHDVLRRAMRDGNAPHLSHWVHELGYTLERWETDWSSQTGACQAGLLHGDNHDMPAFRWWDKDEGRALVTNHPRDAAEIERRHSNGRGLLYADGASRANILSGDAPHSMLTMSTVLEDRHSGRLGQDYFAYFASPYGVARTILRSIGEVFLERVAAIQQVRRDVQPRIKRGWSYALVRGYATVVQLDLQVSAVTADILAGRPVVYTTFLAYDEVAHHSGLERADTLAVLRRVDRAISQITAAVPHAPRPYRVVVLSDHGQSQGATFLQRFDERLEDIVERHGAGEVRAEDADSAEARQSLNAGMTELAGGEGGMSRVMRTLHRAPKQDTVDPSLPEVSVMASGNLGLITFPREPGRLSIERIEALRPGLIETLRAHPGIGFVLVRSEDGEPLVLGAHGERRLESGQVNGEDPLAPFGPSAAGHVARTDAFPHCPDIIVNSTWWSDLDEVAAFEELVGSHGGLGGGQAHPFALVPPELPWPDEPVVGAAAVHRILRGWLAELGQKAYET